MTSRCGWRRNWTSPASPPASTASTSTPPRWRTCATASCAFSRGRSREAKHDASREWPEATIRRAEQEPVKANSATEVLPPAETPARERRRTPRIADTPPVPPPPPKLDDYLPIIGQPDLDELRFLASHLRGKTAKMINSTAVGGGVAEMLNRLVPLLQELEVPTRWDIITG